MLGIGPQELLLILLVALIVVGPKRLPEMGRTIGRALNEFRKMQDEVRDLVKFDLSSDPGPPATSNGHVARPPTEPEGQEPATSDEAAAGDGG
jgi:Tat protein translocase TatB subunit